MSTQQIVPQEPDQRDVAVFESSVRALTPRHRQQLAELLQEHPELFPAFMENIRLKNTPGITQQQLLAAEKEALLRVIHTYEN